MKAPTPEVPTSEPPRSGLLAWESLDGILTRDNSTEKSRALAVACVEMNFTAIRMLFQHYADITAPIDEDQKTPLDVVVLLDDPRLNSLLMGLCDYKEKAIWRSKVKAAVQKQWERDNPGFLESINTPNEHGYCHLHSAVLLDKPAAVELLLEHGANPLITIRGKVTALHLAASESKVDIIPLLARIDGVLEAVDANGATALHTAMVHDDATVTDALLLAGANVDAVNAQGNTPLHLACTRGHLAQVRTLLNAKASRITKGSENLTPAELARRYGHAQILLLLEPQPAVASNPETHFAPPKQGSQATAKKVRDKGHRHDHQKEAGPAEDKRGCLIQ